jgi:hypothetical protein
MNNYNDTNDDIISKLIFIMIFFFGHVFFYYNIYNKDLVSIYCHDDSDDEEILTHASEKTKQTVPEQEQEAKQPIRVPYEEKYLTKVRNMKNEYIFTDEELEIQQKKLEEFKKEENDKKLESTYILNEKIEELTMKLLEINDSHDSDNKSKKNTKKDTSIIKKLLDSIQCEIDLNKKQLFELQQDTTNIDDLTEKAQQFIIDEQLKKFNKNYVIEHTPLGNVLMFYNHNKLAFDYYSDLTIPYRYLETVARKYVLTYNYRPLYIDMDEELKEYEKKLEEKEAKEKQEAIRLQSDSNSTTKTKDVFAKFKSYNKEAGTGRVNTAPPPKNSIPQNRVTTINLKDKKDGTSNEKMLLKERSNRYSYQGKFVNFNILQKVDKKVVDKKYALTFADFKKMNKL